MGESGGADRGAALDMGSPTLETSSGSAPACASFRGPCATFLTNLGKIN